MSAKLDMGKPVERGMQADAVILVVEDQTADVMVILRAFKEAKLENQVLVVNNGEEAIQYLSGEGIYTDRRKYPLPQLMLLDLKMPRVGGFDVLRWLRTRPDLKGIVTVVLTLSSELRDVNEAYQLGASSFLMKPDDFSNVTAMSRLLKDYWEKGNKSQSVMQRPKTQENSEGQR